MTISPANMMLAVSVLLGAVSIFLQFRLKSRKPEQRALLIKSNPIRMTNKAPLLVLFVFSIAFPFVPHSYKFIAFALLLLGTGVASVAQHRTLLRLGADPAFVKRWSGTSVLLFLAGATFTGALYLGG